MADFENAAPFGARTLPSCDRDGRDLLLVIVAARFTVPPPRSSGTHVHTLETQSPPPLGDEYVGAPGRSSLRNEGQMAYTRPATDVSILGHACAPEGKLVRRMSVNVEVGPCSATLDVSGDRVWQRGAVGARPSPAEPFERIALVWERAYGGVAANSTEKKPVYEPRNPVGCGLETDADNAIDKPVPNIEDPGQPIRGLTDRPRPVGLAPIARQWQPRVRYAGTYDEAWRRRRAPLWPEDFDERFFCSAPSQLQARPHLHGGERVSLDGLHPAGAIRFHLPVVRLVVRSRFVDRTVRTKPVLDGVVIDTDSLELTMYFRASVPAPLSLLRHRETLLRLLEPWERVTDR
jgi:hypothetical protein